MEFSFTNLNKVFVKAVLQIRRIATYSSGGTNRAPSISFVYNGETKYITPRVTCESLHHPIVDAYVDGFFDETLREFMQGLGYNGKIDKATPKKRVELSL